MKLRTKVAILIVAVFLSFAGFNLIVSFVPPELIKAKNDTGHEINSDMLVKTETVTLHSNLI